MGFTCNFRHKEILLTLISTKGGHFLFIVFEDRGTKAQSFYKGTPASLMKIFVPPCLCVQESKT